MFELPECTHIADQLSQVLAGKRIKRGTLGNSPHKFVWYNRKPAEFESLTRSKTVGASYSNGRWVFVPLNPGYVLVLGECGGKVLYHGSESDIPRKYHLLLRFDDGSALSVTTQMWGAMELYKKGEELKRKYIRDTRPTPMDDGFTFQYFNALVDECIVTEKTSVKGLLTQNQLIPGLGNSIAQDIMFNAGLHPKHGLEDLNKAARRKLYDSILKTVSRAISLSGRNDERDIFNQPGRYVRVLDKNSLGKPCPKCGRKIEKMQYLGGACYYCPSCQE
jgi:formamidopyrimidine-DNA glycosylase